MIRFKPIRSMGEGNYGHYLAKASDAPEMERDGALAGYYSKNQTYKGKWLGKEAETFGLAGKEIEVDDPAFEKFNEGLAPDGTPLGQRKIVERKPTYAQAHEALKREMKREPDEAEVKARLRDMNSKGPIRFYDATASVDKSFSIAAITGQDEQLKALFAKSIEEVFAEAIEPLVARRVRTGEAASSIACEITARAVAGLWLHDLSRENEAQLHAHLVMPSFTVGSDGKRYALDPQMVAKAIRRAGKLLQSKLATGAQELGYRVENRIDEKGRITGFRLADITEAMEKSQSSRSAQVDAAEAEFVRQNGRAPTDAERTVLVRQTANRSNSREVLTQEILEEQAAKMGRDEYMRLLRIVHAARARREEPPETENSRDAEAARALVADKAVASAAKHLEERLQIWPRHVLEAEALNLCLGRATADDVLAAVERAIGAEKNSVLVGRRADEHNLFRGISTPRAVRHEMFSLDRIAATRGTLPSLAEFKAIEGLSADQNSAVKFVAECRDRSAVLLGLAGAGKTQTCKGIQRALEKTGKNIIVITPTTSAADVWRKDGFEANTIESFLAKMNDPKKSNAVKNAFVIVDESSMVSGRVGAELLRQAERLNQRLLFVGDTRQHSSVESCDWMRVTMTASKIARHELKEIWRQKHLPYRRAIEIMGGVARDEAGKRLPASVPDGMKALDDMGWLHEVAPHGATGEDGKPKANAQKGGYLGAAARRYIERTAGGSRFEDCLLVSPTHEENRILTAAVRAELQSLGVLDRSKEFKRSVAIDLNLTTSQKLDPARYHEGEFLVARGAMGKLKTGESCKILRAGQNPEGKAVLFLANGDEVILSQRGAGEFAVARMEEIGICPGDRVQSRQNHKEMTGHTPGKYISAGGTRKWQKGKKGELRAETELINGRCYTVAEIRDNGDIVTTEGKIIPAHFSQLAHGYAITSVKSQGDKAKYAIGAGAAFSGKSAYVTASRGVEVCDFFIPDREHFYKSIGGSGDRASVTEEIRARQTSETERAVRAAARRIESEVSCMRQFFVRSGAAVRSILRIGLSAISRDARNAQVLARGQAGYIAAQREARDVFVPGRSAGNLDKGRNVQRSR